MTWKYLHRVGHHVSYLDAAVLPEVGAMFCAMMSRVPKGGIEARYRQVVEKIEASLPDNNLRSEIRLAQAEEHLCKYIDGQLHPVIQEFFDQFVLKYGHGSIKELTGKPVVFIEHISIWFAYLTFDNPLVRGQEMSTRAIWRKDWAVGSDAEAPYPLIGDWQFQPTPALKEMHDLGLEIAGHEIEAWKQDFRAECPTCEGVGIVEDVSGDIPEPVKCPPCKGTGKKHPTFDPQASAFRPAFDRARWALPGCIETGVGHAADVRTMGRVIQVMEDIATASGQESALRILEEVKEGYSRALPGMAGMWNREAVHDSSLSDEPLEEPLLAGTLRAVRASPFQVASLEWSADVQDQKMSISGTIVLEDDGSYNNVSDDLHPLNVTGMGVSLMGVEILGDDGMPLLSRADIKPGKSYPVSIRAVSQQPHIEPVLSVDSDGKPKDVVVDSFKKSRSPQKIPGHLRIDRPAPFESRDVQVSFYRHRNPEKTDIFIVDNPAPRLHRRSYVDPYWNHFGSVDWKIRCSWACVRDWHRHRTSYPIQLRPARRHFTPEIPVKSIGSDDVIDTIQGRTSFGPLELDHHYAPISEFGEANFERYMTLCTELHDKFLAEGNLWMAMCCIPLGTRMALRGQAGLQHAVYTFELRGYVAGGNFEYAEQAKDALKQIEDSCKPWPEVVKALAFDQDPAQGSH